MAGDSRAVFPSYASGDSAAAPRIADALKAAGIEVCFDGTELRGGDAWDQKRRREIRDSARFVPVIPANAAARREGRLRLERDLADPRTHMIVPELGTRKRATPDRRRLRRDERGGIVAHCSAWIAWQRRLLVRWEDHPANVLGCVQLAARCVLREQS